MSRGQSNSVAFHDCVELLDGTRRRASLDIAFRIELTSVTRTLKQFAVCIPFLAASQMRATVVKRRYRTVGML